MARCARARIRHSAHPRCRSHISYALPVHARPVPVPPVRLTSLLPTLLRAPPSAAVPITPLRHHLPRPLPCLRPPLVGNLFVLGPGSSTAWNTSLRGGLSPWTGGIGICWAPMEKLDGLQGDSLNLSHSARRSGEASSLAWRLTLAPPPGLSSTAQRHALCHDDVPHTILPAAVSPNWWITLVSSGCC